jgi:uncharacterized protein (DUF305 family)
MKRCAQLFFVALLFLLLTAGTICAGEKGHEMKGHEEGHTPTSPAMVHMRHAEMIHSEKDFLKEMIPHHQEAVDTSVLLFVSTEDQKLKKLTEDIYMAQTKEILDMRLYYAKWYNQIPTGAMYQPMMRSLNEVDGKKRDIRYVQDMIVHHEGALEMAEKVLGFDGLHAETVKFARVILKTQKAEIEFMRNWLKENNAKE